MNSNIDPTQMYVTTSVSELAKSQTVRVADVFIIGPLMIYGGCLLAKYELRKSNFPIGLALMGVGIGTILYNGRNYLANQRTIIKL